MHLSAHFTLDEFTSSQVAARRGIDNTPTPPIVERLKRTAQGLETVRQRLGGFHIIVTSGYRCERLNRLVKGAKGSQHILGEAADFICPRFGAPADIAAALRDSELDYDQLILEFGEWVHISFADRPRHQALVIDRSGTRPMWSDR